MKVCYWSPSAGGGAGKYEYYLTKEIERLGVGTEIFKKPNGLKGNPATVRMFYKNHGDIVHATSQTLSLYSFPKPEKFIITNHGLRFTTRVTLEERVKRFFTSKTLDRADKIIAVSEFTKNEAINKLGIDEDKVVVIHLGIDLSKYKQMNKEYCRSLLGLDPHEKYILVVATKVPLKRLDISKAVFQQIRNHRDDLNLIKCGSGNLEGDRIINLGLVTEDKMPILYNAVDLLLHTSEYESFGMPLLEAMACGIPIVASKKAAIPEIVGNCGELVNLDSDDCVKQFVDKSLDYINKGEVNYKGIKRSKYFSWKKTTKKTLEIYREMIE